LHGKTLGRCERKSIAGKKLPDDDAHHIISFSHVHSSHHEAPGNELAKVLMQSTDKKQAILIAYITARRNMSPLSPSPLQGACFPGPSIFCFGVTADVFPGSANFRDNS
jgi:hypothetical protein